jgi:hypothetical protein
MIFDRTDPWRAHGSFGPLLDADMVVMCCLAQENWRSTHFVKASGRRYSYLDKNGDGLAGE